MVPEVSQYGYDPSLISYLQKDDKSIPLGSFTILKRGPKLYWYFNLSKGENRLIYLCSTDDDGEERSSFLNSIKILKRKQSGDTNPKKRKRLTELVDDHSEHLLLEGRSTRRGTERSINTIYSKRTYLNRFRNYVSQHPVSLSVVTKTSFRGYFDGFIDHLIDQDFSKTTIRQTLTTVIQFLDSLTDSDGTKPIITSHPISRKWVRERVDLPRSIEDHPSFYKRQNYIELVDTITRECRNIWKVYLETKVIPNPSKSVYFTSLLQLIYGFRIGEVFRCYLDEEIKDRFHNGKQGYSFLIKDDESEGWFFEVYFKKRHGIVFVDFRIYSWTEPPSTVSFINKKEMGGHFQTNIIDVMRKLFSTNRFLVRSDLVKFYQWFNGHLKDVVTPFGLTSSHDFRDMSINYMIHTQKQSLVDVSQMTRHSVKTLEKYYLHKSKDLSRLKSKQMNTKNRLKDVFELRKLIKSESELDDYTT